MTIFVKCLSLRSALFLGTHHENAKKNVQYNTINWNLNRLKYWLQTKVLILSGWSVKLSNHLHLASWLWISGAITLLPLHALMMLTGKKFTFYLLPILHDSKIVTILIWKWKHKLWPRHVTLWAAVIICNITNNFHFNWRIYYN